MRYINPRFTYLLIQYVNISVKYVGSVECFVSCCSLNSYIWLH